MKTITITTPDNIEIEYRLAEAGSRIAAMALDFLIQVILILLITGITFFLLSYSTQDITPGHPLNGLTDTLNGFSGYTVAFAILSCFLIYFGYFVICEISMRGQTLGKRIFGLRVLRENGQPVGLTQSLVRNIIRYFIDMTGIGLIMIVLSKKCKRLGDIAASTIVIAENAKKITIEALSPEDFQEAEEIAGTDIKKLSPDEYYLLKEYFLRRNGFPDKGGKIRQSLMAYFSTRKSTAPYKSSSYE